MLFPSRLLSGYLVWGPLSARPVGFRGHSKGAGGGGGIREEAESSSIRMVVWCLCVCVLERLLEEKEVFE